MDPVIVSLADAALHYTLPRRTLQRWVAEGRMINHGSPRHIHVDLYEVDQLYRLRNQDGRTGLPDPRSWRMMQSSCS